MSEETRDAYELMLREEEVDALAERLRGSEEPADRRLLTALNIWRARTPGEPNSRSYHDVTM